jgi:hypothetical protein
VEEQGKASPLVLFGGYEAIEPVVGAHSRPRVASR